MPAYHLKRADGSGITMVNIGVGPSNAKTITDHIAVLRPHAWIMLGHCAGLRNTQRLGDYVLAHGYVREDHVLDEDLPLWVPIPALAEVQVALEEAVAQVTQLEGAELKRVMRTGTVASVDNRNWELRDHREPVQRLSQSRAIALDMESATIAANGFRFRVPYGTLLCVSDKPLHGELKLPGMADQFYRAQVDQHLQIGVKAMEMLRTNGLSTAPQPQAAQLRRSRVPVARVLWRTTKAGGLYKGRRAAPSSEIEHPVFVGLAFGRLLFRFLAVFIELEHRFEHLVRIVDHLHQVQVLRRRSRHS